MSKTKIASILVLFLMFSVVTGCNLFNKEPAKTPEEVVRSAMINSQNIKTATVNVVMNGSVVNEAGAVKQQVDLNLNVAEKFDINDAKNPKLDIDMAGDVTIEGKKYNGEVGLRMMNRKMYFSILKYPDPKEFPDMAMVATFADKWFFLSMDEVGQTVPLMSLDEASMTPEMKQIKKEAQKTNFFKDLKYVGTEDASGESAYKYTGSIDMDKVYAFIDKISEINKKTQTEEEKAQIKKALSGLNIPLTLWVSVDDEVMLKVAGTINYNDADTKVSAKIDFTSDVLGIGKDVVIEEPKNPVDLKQVISSMMGGAAAGADDVVLPAPTK
ncbi:MAG: hypothetical protein UT33_C0007G0092 [Candidatus Peregrinibacteria bacterium GW2011_GWC2_39_14]|nr:MAG: hypothetical protein US92_C0002G0094 [Candidatus Peregrinibacteria bacterium GW2011_GWA2_38_36]KKR06904.1 MAG: hypothetical protein UT33_C0007G0092 [Candidatus Peregrinibacteria bacterium GW2011_GWC2_39_14]